jgi:hypothetical protein
LNIAAGVSSVVVGGGSNTAIGDYSAIVGGAANRADGPYSTIVGGALNNAWGSFSAAWGSHNNAPGYGATAAGGYANGAFGAMSFAAGHMARAHVAQEPYTGHNGAFVWADFSNVAFHTVVDNEFAARSTGGVRFVTAIEPTGTPSWTCGVSGGAGGSWGCTSDREAKTDLTPLDGVATLERLAALPVYQWTAKDDPRRTPHAGPTAQDFMAAFGLGDNDRMIGFADAQGVAFAAIQGLNAKLDERDAALRADMQAKDAEVTALRQELARLRQAVDAVLAYPPTATRDAQPR